jgi:hypothetical protein
VRLQESEAGERDVPGRERREDHGETPRHTGGFDASTRFVFAELQMFQSPLRVSRSAPVLEKRGIAASEHDRTGVEFRQMRDDVGHACSLRRNEHVEVSEEADVGEFIESHPFQ